jgi:predicted RecA/RadA family phage recombinase
MMKVLVAMVMGLAMFVLVAGTRGDVSHNAIRAVPRAAARVGLVTTMALGTIAFLASSPRRRSSSTSAEAGIGQDRRRQRALRTTD